VTETLTRKARLQAKARKDKKPEKRKETLPESIGSIASVFVCGLFIITFVVQAFEIPSGSMENTLLIGDHVFVDRLTPAAKSAYVGPLMPYRDVRRDEVIVFLHPKEPGMYVVKRIVGVPGDRIHLEHGQLFVNGKPQNEPYLNPDRGFYNEYRDDFPKYPAAGVPNVYSDWPIVLQGSIRDGEIVVPKDSYFGMGDNRAESLDSRYWGFIPRENIIGRPLFIYWSFDTPRDQYQRTSIGDRAAFIFHIITHFLGDTRWSRMFHLIR
jgi:signal peptidase I